MYDILIMVWLIPDISLLVKKWLVAKYWANAACLSKESFTTFLENYFKYT